jgi:hypothetical protein
MAYGSDFVKQKVSLRSDQKRDTRWPRMQRLGPGGWRGEAEPGAEWVPASLVSFFAVGHRRAIESGAQDSRLQMILAIKDRFEPERRMSPSVITRPTMTRILGPSPRLEVLADMTNSMRVRDLPIRADKAALSVELRRLRLANSATRAAGASP